MAAAAAAAGRDDKQSSSGLQSRPPQDESCPNCGGRGWPDRGSHAASSPAGRGPCQICLSPSIGNDQYARGTRGNDQHSRGPTGNDQYSRGGAEAEARTGSADGVGDGPQSMPGAE